MFKGIKLLRVSQKQEQKRCYTIIPALALGQWFSIQDKNAGKSEAYKVKQSSEQSS